jgi:hypothetical protein
MPSTPNDQLFDPLDSSMYRLGHLHGDQWVTLTPATEHSPTADDPLHHWARGRMYECSQCDVKVMIAPPAGNPAA